MSSLATVKNMDRYYHATGMPYAVIHYGIGGNSTGVVRVVHKEGIDFYSVNVDELTLEQFESIDRTAWLRWICSIHSDYHKNKLILIGYVVDKAYLVRYNCFEMEVNQFTLITVPDGVDAQEVLDWEWSLHQAEPGDRDYARAIYSDWCESHGMTMRAKQLRNGKAE